MDFLNNEEKKIKEKIEKWLKSKDYKDGDLEQNIDWLFKNDINKYQKLFRKFLKEIDIEHLKRISKECLDINRDEIKKGDVFQDIVNTIGEKIGFEVKLRQKPYTKGSSKNPGYDGIWRGNKDYTLLVEVKCSASWPIYITRLIKYKENSLKNDKGNFTDMDFRNLNENGNSILIIIGKNEKGNMEDLEELKLKIIGAKRNDINIITLDTLLYLLDNLEFCNNNDLVPFLTSEEKIFIDNIKLPEKTSNKVSNDLVKKSEYHYHTTDNKTGYVFLHGKVSKTIDIGYDNSIYFTNKPDNIKFLNEYENKIFRLIIDKYDVIFDLSYLFLLEKIPSLEKSFYKIPVFKKNDKYCLKYKKDKEINYEDITEYIVKK